MANSMGTGRGDKFGTLIKSITSTKVNDFSFFFSKEKSAVQNSPQTLNIASTLTSKGLFEKLPRRKAICQ